MSFAQINIDRVTMIGQNALYYEDYILAIQYFNEAIEAKPYLAEPYFYRAIAKFYLADYKGAEDDCSLALDRNSFMSRAYQLRGIACQNQGLYANAIHNYKRMLYDYPNDKLTLQNISIANAMNKNYVDAINYMDQFINMYPNEAEGYLTRGKIYQEKGDTLRAFSDYNKSISLDGYLPDAYSSRGILYYYKKEFHKSLDDMDKAVQLSPMQTGSYINRGMVRYNLDDLRGAMADYDKVVSLEPDNVIAHFNRGLLRLKVGDYNRAVDDFDLVIRSEPKNYIAYLNRAILKNIIGDYNGALSDLNIVLDRYPNFYQGFYTRSDIEKHQNNLKIAQKDYNKAREIEARVRKNALETKDKHVNKTREDNDDDIDKFQLLVVASKKQDEKSKYGDQARGLIQNRDVDINLQPRFLLSYYEKTTDLKHTVYYSYDVDSYNKKMILPKELKITDAEIPLNQLQIQDHFRSINHLSKEIVSDTANPDLYFARAMDYTLVQDFTSAIEDYKHAIDLRPDFMLAYFNLGVVYTKQLISSKDKPVYEEGQQANTLHALGGDNTNNSSSGVIGMNPIKFDYEFIMRSYEKVIELKPNFAYVYYNRAEIEYNEHDFRAAETDYSDAIKRKPDFAEAYYNRALSRFQLKKKDTALDDMRKAGELGIVDAYSIIKRMTN